MKTAGKRIIKKHLALLLALVMVLGMVPFTAMATPPSQIVERGGTLYYGNGSDAGEDRYALGLGSSGINDWVEVSKEVYDTDGTSGARLPENVFRIDLKVNTKMDMEGIEFNEDAAVCVVFDISSSMDWCKTCGNSAGGNTHGTGSGRHTFGSRMDEAKSALRTFLTEYQASATLKESGTNSRRLVSLVLFGTDAEAKSIGGNYWFDIANGVTVNTVMNAITVPSGTRYTNIEGGLMLARNLWRVDAGGAFAGYTDITNLTTILFTDGEANRLVNTASTAHNVVITGKQHSSGTDANITGSTNAARTMATQLKAPSFSVTTHDNKCTHRYVTGGVCGKTESDTHVLGIFTHTFTPTYTTTTHNIAQSTVYAIRYGEAQKSLMDNVASRLDTSLNATGAGQLALAFEAISKNINLWADAWVVRDPMADNIVWDSTRNSALEAESYISWDDQNASNTIVWRLQDMPASSITGRSGWKSYAISYYVELDTLGSALGVPVPTNNETTLTYVIMERTDVTTGGGTTSGTPVNLTGDDPAIARFLIPEVKGFAAPFSFTKKDNAGGIVEGAEFDLFVNGGDTPFKTVTSTSDEKDNVDFGALPSGHVYTLKEKSVPSNTYVLDVDEYAVTVSYGNIGIQPADKALSGNKTDGYVFTNKLAAAAIEISKEIDDAEIDMIEPIAEYTLVVENTGYHPLTKVVVADKLDTTATSIVIDPVVFSGVSTTSYTYTLTGTAGAYTGFEMSLPFSESAFQPGDMITITYTVEYDQVINADDVGRDNTAEVTAKSTITGDTVTNSDSAEAVQEGATKEASIVKSVYSINRDTDLSEHRTNPTTGNYVVENGDVIIYKITVTNDGDIGLVLQAIEDRLAGAERCNADGTMENLDDVAGPIPSGQSRIVYYKLTVTGKNNGETISNTATATFGNHDSKTSGAVTVEVVKPTIDVTKVIDSATINYTDDGVPLFPHGADITFKITINNTGDADATTLLTDEIKRLGDSSYDPQNIVFYTLSGDDKITVTDNNITVPARGSVVVFYDVKAEGQTDANWELAVEKAFQAVAKAYDDYQIAIEDAQTAINYAMDNVLGYQKAVGVAEQALNDAFESYNVAGSAIYEYEQVEVEDDEGNVSYVDGEIIDIIYPEVDDTALIAAQGALKQAEEDLADAIGALEAAQGVLDSLIKAGDILTDGEDPEFGIIAAAEAALEILIGNKGKQVFKYTNHATYLDKTDEVSFAVDYERLPFLTLEKVVSVNSGDATKFAAIKEGDEFVFTIKITNIGDVASEPMVLRDYFGDDLVGIEIKVPSIEPGPTNAVIYTFSSESEEYDWSDLVTNNSFTEAKLVTNTAILGRYDEDNEFKQDHLSSASVVIPPQPVARLSIDKRVRVAGSDVEFEKFAVKNSNEPVEFEFQITITNTGNADAEVLVKDFIRNAESESLVDSLEGDIDEGGYVTVPKAGSVVLTMMYEVAVDKSETNVASYSTDAKNVINPKGSSSAVATVNGVPHSILSVEKHVYSGSTFVDSTDFYVSAGTTKDAIFRIRVKNEGNVTGQFTLVDEFEGGIVNIDDLYLHWSFGEDDRLVDDESIYNSEGDYISVRAGEHLDIYYKAEALGARTGAYVNNVTIEGVREEPQDDEWVIFDVIEKPTANANVTIYEKTAVMITVNIDKKVALAGAVEDPADIPDDEWKDEISVTTNGSVEVFYRITVTKVGIADYAISGSISDLLGDKEFELSEEQKYFEIGTGETTWTTYLGVVTLSGAGTHRNVAAIEEVAFDGGGDEEREDVTVIIGDESEADVVIITPPTGGGEYIPIPPSNTPTTDTDPVDDGEPTTEPAEPEEFIDLDDTIIPLDEFPPFDDPAMIPEDPEDYFDLYDNDVPLDELPQTGLPHLVPLTMLGLGGAALAGGVLLGRKKKNEDIK